MEVGKHWLCGGNTKQCGGKASGPRIMGGPKCSAWEFLFHLPSNKMTTLELCSGKINISTMGQKWGPLALLNYLHKFFCVCHSVTAFLSMHNIKKFTRENPSRVIIFLHVYEKAKGLTYVTEFPQKSIESSDLRTQ